MLIYWITLLPISSIYVQETVKIEYAVYIVYCHMQDKTYYSMKHQSLALTLLTVLYCKAMESVM